jgi:beta-lactamase class A
VPNLNKIRRIAKHNRLKIIILLVTVICTTFFITKKDQNDKTIVSQPQQETIQTNDLPSKVKPNQNVQNLLDTQVQNQSPTYAIFIKNLKTGSSYQINQDLKIPSASLYKLAVMYTAYDLLQKGQIQKDQEIADGLTVESALELMITVSDNNSALKLAEKIGWTNINSFIKNQGINGFNLLVKDYPQTTAKAVADLLERIYTKTAVSQIASEEMLNLLLKQQINDRIPKYLPLDVKIAHKTGEVDNLRHDAGIIFGKNSDYIFAFLTDTPIPQDGAENIAKLSKTMFEVLENPQSLK